MAEGARPTPSGEDAGRLEAEVARNLTPTPELLERVRSASAALVARAEETARRRNLPLQRALVAGSAARTTFLPDRLDIDLFLLFPPTLDRAQLESAGLELAGALLESAETRYAEHPYLRGTFEGFAVDAVPGYAIDDPSHPQSAVDRTPFHQAYLMARSTPASASQVRLTKQFLRSLGVYGAESKTSGFSGYLVELLVLRFGSLQGILEAARSWTIPVHLPTDPAARPRVPEDVALVLDDPVDPHRNVASALSRRNLGLFELAAAEYRDRPDRRFFETRPASTIDLARGLSTMRTRGTHVAVLRLPRPRLVDDILFPQLRKAERGLASAAERLGFTVLGTASAADATGLAILLEVDHRHLPAVQRRDGPPAGIDRSSAFLERWAEEPHRVLQGPYVDDAGRLAVETRRDAGDLEALLSGELPRLPIGRDLVSQLPKEATLGALAEAEDSEAIRRALGELFGKALPWLRFAQPKG